MLFVNQSHFNAEKAAPGRKLRIWEAINPPNGAIVEIESVENGTVELVGYGGKFSLDRVSFTAINQNSANS